MASLRNGARIDPVRNIAVVKAGETIHLTLATGSRGSPRHITVELDAEEAETMIEDLTLYLTKYYRQ